MLPIAALLSIGEKVLDKVFPDPEAKAKAQATLMEMAQKGQLAELEAHVKEMDSARKREIEIATSEFAPTINKIVTPILALGTVSLTFILFLVIIFVEVNTQSKDILIYVLGALTSAMTMVLGYYFGSSQGSKEKSQQLDEIMDKKEMNLTANFSLAEMVKSDTALRHDMDNTPGEAEIANLKTLCEKVLQPVRDKFQTGVKVNSGFRHPEVNAKVGGSKTSDHCKGQAADIEIPGIANADLAVWIMDNLEYTQLILEFYTPGVPDSGWVHVSYDPANLKKQNLTATKQNGKTVYLPGLVA
jgi:zinc D-Ala-D-Ala carboxypeptidase